jgi:hypothetical protein
VLNPTADHLYHQVLPEYHLDNVKARVNEEVKFLNQEVQYLQFFHAAPQTLLICAKLYSMPPTSSIIGTPCGISWRLKNSRQHDDQMQPKENPLEN